MQEFGTPKSIFFFKSNPLFLAQNAFVAQKYDLLYEDIVILSVLDYINRCAHLVIDAHIHL